MPRSHARCKMGRAAYAALAEPISRDPDGNEVTLLDILPDEGERVEDRVARRQQDARLLQVIASRLGGRERQVLRLRYGFGGSERRTQREIARLLNISRSYVSRACAPPWSRGASSTPTDSSGWLPWRWSWSASLFPSTCWPRLNGTASYRS